MCPTFVYGLPCDYVVFAKAFTHHVRNFFPNVPVHAKSKRIIGCPTFVYGLASDYAVFAEAFSRHVQKLFPNVLVNANSKRIILAVSSWLNSRNLEVVADKRCLAYMFG